MRVDPDVKYAAALAILLVAPLAAGPGDIGPRPAAAWEDDEEAFQDDAPEPEEFEEELAPHGDWLEVGDYGRVWHPWVAVGWQPYVDGYWSWSPWGWFWVSYEPWAWTFHYGRWSLVPAYGWVWVPGTVWGPAWVDWYWGAGYVGWAPLAPFATHVTVVDHFVFVHERDFCSRGIARRVQGHRLVPDQVIHEWRHREFRAPDRQRIERVSAHPVSRLERKPATSLLRAYDRSRRARRTWRARRGARGSANAATSCNGRRGGVAPQRTSSPRPGRRAALARPRPPAGRSGRGLRAPRPRARRGAVAAAAGPAGAGTRPGRPPRARGAPLAPASHPGPGRGRLRAAAGAVHPGDAAAPPAGGAPHGSFAPPAGAGGFHRPSGGGGSHGSFGGPGR
jgi:hypothetical protein